MVGKSPGVILRIDLAACNDNITLLDILSITHRDFDGGRSDFFHGDLACFVYRCYVRFAACKSNAFHVHRMLRVFISDKS